MGSLRDLNQAVKLAPKSPIALTYRGDALREKGDLDAALRDYSEAAHIAPDFAAAYTGRGLTLEKKGDAAKAKQDFEKAASLSPDVGATLAKPAIEQAKKRLTALAAEEKQRHADAAAKAAPPPPPKPVEEAPIDPGKRVALVIGNSAYREVTPLPNPKRDAQAMEEAFHKLGFATVIAAYDTTRKDLIAALRRFQEKLDQADWGVIYYAGHGIEVAGQNYLIPIDAKLSTDTDAEDEAVSLQRLQRAMMSAKHLKLSVVFLDACRNNVFTNRMRRTLAYSRSVERGLAPIEPDQGSMIVYATRDGQTAEDGAGQHSPFTQALLNNILTPRFEVNRMCRRVRREVMDMTGQKQEPMCLSALPDEDLYFAVK